MKEIIKNKKIFINENKFPECKFVKFLSMFSIQYMIFYIYIGVSQFLTIKKFYLLIKIQNKSNIKKIGLEILSSKKSKK